MRRGPIRPSVSAIEARARLPMTQRPRRKLLRAARRIGAERGDKPGFVAQYQLDVGAVGVDKSDGQHVLPQSLSGRDARNRRQRYIDFQRAEARHRKHRKGKGERNRQATPIDRDDQATVGRAQSAQAAQRPARTGGFAKGRAGRDARDDRPARLHPPPSPKSDDQPDPDQKYDKDQAGHGCASSLRPLPSAAAAWPLRRRLRASGFRRRGTCVRRNATGAHSRRGC
jgi:hypothetical protein